MLNVGFGFEEFVDQLCTLVFVLGTEERLRFAGGRNAADGVQVDPADESVVIGRRIGFQVVLFPIGLQHRIDFCRGFGYINLSCGEGRAEETGAN
jgi:hypothetical protein